MYLKFSLYSQYPIFVEKTIQDVIKSKIRETIFGRQLKK